MNRRIIVSIILLCLIQLFVGCRSTDKQGIDSKKIASETVLGFNLNLDIEMEATADVLVDSQGDLNNQVDEAEAESEAEAEELNLIYKTMLEANHSLMINPIITPNQDPYNSILIAFNMPQLSDLVKIIVFDSSNKLIGEFETSVTIMDVYMDGQLQPLFSYKGEILGLEPDRAYEYVIQYEQQYSPLYSFRTMNNVNPGTFVLFGDTQGYKLSQYENFRNTFEIAMETAGNVDISLIAGDIVDTGDEFGQWSYFYQSMEDVFSEQRLLTTIGNHDVKNSPEIYLNSFNYPKNGVEGLEERNFYIDVPFGRIAIWDTESPEAFDEQSEWLKDIMAESEGKFKIVLMHRCVYPMLYDESYIRKLAPVFEAAGIHLVLSGHDHIYSRTTMKEDKKVEVGEGVTYIVAGSSSGSKYYETKDEAIRYWKDVVYDEDNPVFTVLTMEEKVLQIKAYGVIENIAKEVDNLKLYLP